MIAIFEPKKSLNWVLQEFSGPDARDFLHRLTTVNLHRMNPGDGSLGFFLNAVGKVRAQFFLGCLAEDRFVFEYDAGREGAWSRALAETIDQCTFAEKQQLAPSSALDCVWVFSDSPAELPNREQLAGCVVLDRGSRDFGLHWWSIWGESARLSSWSQSALPGARSLDWTELDRRRISQIRPWVDHELTPEVIPLEIGLYDGVAENKGCYPGQEVIERLITQGAPPRRLVRVEASGAGSVEGTLVEVAATTWSSREGLALVRKNFATEGQKLSIFGQGEVTVKACCPDTPFSSP